jgi:hypothetical protein
MSVSSYDAKQVSVSFAGLNLTGFAPGSFVNVEHNEDIFTLVVGADGDATRSRTNNNSGTFTLTLQQASGSNSDLTALYTLDAGTLGALGTGPMLIKDSSGNTLMGAEVAWIRKLPAVEFGVESTNRVWVFETDNLTMFVGSNNVLGSDGVENEAGINLSTI